MIDRDGPATTGDGNRPVYAGWGAPRADATRYGETIRPVTRSVRSRSNPGAMAAAWRKRRTAAVSATPMGRSPVTIASDFSVAPADGTLLHPDGDAATIGHRADAVAIGDDSGVASSAAGFLLRAFPDPMPILTIMSAFSLIGQAMRPGAFSGFGFRRQPGCAPTVAARA